MKILINCSNLRQGGGIQVADSICSYLEKYQMHHFIVVLSTALMGIEQRIGSYNNVSVVHYDLPKTLRSSMFQRDRFLDELVEKEKIDVVLTVFGPARWKPRVPHLCGFARAHILPMDTPYFDNLPIKDRILNYIVKKSFEKSAENYWTENPAVTTLLQRVFPRKKIYTVSNTYNQVFDDSTKWKEHTLPLFKGVTLLTVTNAHPHKNLELALGISKELRQTDPDFKFRFVFTIDKNEYQKLPEELEECFCFIGRVDIAECPSLYQQADIMFQPTLLECFTATYAEAMRMEVPIVTTALPFAKGLCQDAALYFAPLSAKEAAQCIYKVSHDEKLRGDLIEAGKNQLETFATAEQRADRLVAILEEVAGKKEKQRNE